MKEMRLMVELADLDSITSISFLPPVPIAWPTHVERRPLQNYRFRLGRNRLGPSGSRLEVEPLGITDNLSIPQFDGRNRGWRKNLRGPLSSSRFPRPLTSPPNGDILCRARRGHGP